MSSFAHPAGCSSGSPPPRLLAWGTGTPKGWREKWPSVTLPEGLSEGSFCPQITQIYTDKKFKDFFLEIIDSSNFFLSYLRNLWINLLFLAASRAATSPSTPSGSPSPKEIKGEEKRIGASGRARIVGKDVGAFSRALFSLLALFVLAVPAARAADGEPRAFVIDNFRLESGKVLPKAVVMYATYGTLDAARDNVILLPSHYMADSHGYEWLIGPDKALDPAKYYLVATELFGNGKSSSPSNTPAPFDGPRFPVTTIRDNVEAVHRLLTEQLKVGHLRAVVGFSMGGQQAFQWAVSHPDFADRIVVTSATAKTWPHGVVRLEGQIAALETDPAFNGGDYTTQPRKGLSAFGMVWAGWLYSQEWWRRELWKTNSPPGMTFDQVVARFRDNFIPGADANNLILQMRTWEAHDVGTTPGFDGDVQRALGSIKAPLLYMPSETDMYFPLEDARYEAGFIPHVTFTPIPSLWGHTAGAASNPADAKFLNDTIGAFLAADPAPFGR